MLSLLLIFLTAQVPAVPGETTLVSFCKQGREAACQELLRLDPRLAAKVMAEAAKSAQRLAAQRAAEEEAREKQDGETGEAEADAAPEPPDCKGQNHHVISRPIFKVLKDHLTLGGLYEERDERFKARAKDKESHCGYQKWHREVDEEVIQWLGRYPKATQKQFESFLREIYNRPAMRERFPNGF
ncbi:MAG TPA: Wall-associated protein precursor [Myxococcaceae bacterium]|nr:Wall-associated protein precursor [Myxococcaceae bacterium]